MKVCIFTGRFPAVTQTFLLIQIAALEARGVSTAVHYARALHEQPVYAERAPGPFPEAERAAREVLALPLWPGISRKQVEYVAEALKSEC